MTRAVKIAVPDILPGVQLGHAVPGGLAALVLLVQLRVSENDADHHCIGSLQAAVRGKLRQHTGLADPLIVVLDLSSPIIEDRDIAAMLYGRTTTTILGPATPVTATRNRQEGIWPDPVAQPPRPAAVLILRGIWLGSAGATAELWLPPGGASPLLPGPWTVKTL